VYYKNGNKWSEGYYKKGLDDGQRTAFHENGEKNFEGRYKDGKMVGTWRFYDETGKQVKEIDYDKQ
jgi:antitoxin component YwqK of YwqJK toxin-antitoxin module